MDNSILRESLRNDKNTVHLLGQEISVEQVTLKIRHFEELSNGFTPRLNLLKVNYPMNDKSALRDVECFFDIGPE